jgi:uncharacterized protein YjbI with pentapeptide repeats
MARKKAAGKRKSTSSAAGTDWQKMRGRTFCLAGRPRKYDKETMTLWIQSLGGQVVDKVTAELDYVVVDSARAKPSTAEKRAVTLNQSGAAGIQVIDENDLESLLTPWRDEAIAMLSAGPAGVEAWNKIHPLLRYCGALGRLDLTGLDLPGADLRSVQLMDVDTSGSNLRGADLRQAVLERGTHLCLDAANLEHARIGHLGQSTAKNARAAHAELALKKCDLEGADLEQARIDFIQQCNLRNTRCPGLVVGRPYYRYLAQKLPAAETDFSGADLTGAHLAKQDVSGSNFSGAKLARADLRHAILRKCRFRNADLHDAQLGGADLSHSDVDGASFEGAGLFGVKLDGIDHARAKGLDPRQIKQPTIGPNLREIDKIAKKADSITASAEVALDQGHVEIKVSGSTYSSYCEWVQHVPGSEPQRGFDSESVKQRSVGQTMIEAAHFWGSGTLVVDSIKASSTKSPVKGGHLKQIVAGAWCEAFGVEVPSEGEIKQQRKSRQSGQKKVREALIEELLGTGGVKKWNARTPAQIAKAGGFRKVDLAGARLSGVHFLRLDLQSANFEGAALSRAKFDECKCQQAIFKGANLQGANLAGSACNSADFASANLSKARLTRCSLRKANFAGAKLRAASLKMADLAGADLTGADLGDAVLAGAVFDEATKFPQRFKLPEDMDWRGTGPNPAVLQAPKKQVGSLTPEQFMARLKTSVDQARLSKALKMLKADRFELFVQVADDSLVGVVKSQTDPDLVYSCRLAADGAFACCTQNLNPCGGLRGALCKHLLVLVIGLARSGDIDAATVDNWIVASKAHRPALDKDIMSETLLRYKGAEAGEIDWRPTETVPEDFYAF